MYIEMFWIYIGYSYLNAHKLMICYALLIDHFSNKFCKYIRDKSRNCLM